jgi:steroid 5-alpha reductase family enzyme
MNTIGEILLFAFVIVLLINAIGFKKAVWFISIGYTFSIIACSLFVLIYKSPDFRFFNWIQIFLLLIWGCRLGFYIIKRESDSNYNSSVKDQTDSSQQLPLIVKTGIWVSVSFLYVCMFSPALFSLQNDYTVSLFQTIASSIGLLVMAAGVIIETVADNQKSAFKKINPKSFCNIGLYRWVRCPNYLGEISVWLGSFICSATFLGTWWQWVTALAGLVCIVLIMMGSAKRLEKKQLQSYGSNPEFRKYEKSVPILFPWTKIYTLQNVKVYLE